MAAIGESKFILEFHDQRKMVELREELLSVYLEVYEDRIHDPFFSPDRFWQRLENYAARGGFSLVTGSFELELVGFTLGFTLPPNAKWWNGIKGEVADEMLVENGSRTFAVAELMVRKNYRRRGYARAMSAALLQHRQEERATLLVRAENAAAKSAYQSWGWWKFGDLQPFEDAPVYEVMLRDLRSHGR